MHMTHLALVDNCLNIINTCKIRGNTHHGCDCDNIYANATHEDIDDSRSTLIVIDERSLLSNKKSS